jgi:hypothetical protein
MYPNPIISIFKREQKTETFPTPYTALSGIYPQGDITQGFHISGFGHGGV